MLARCSMALVTVTAGVALGAAFGAAADPEMKHAPDPPWRGALQAPSAADAGYGLVEAGPGDLSPYRDSYAPSWADEELVDWERDYPAWTYSDLVGEDYTAPPTTEEWPLDEQPAPLEPETTTPLQTAPASPEPVAPAPEPLIAGNLAALY